MAERIELDAGKADVGEFDADDYTASASIFDSNPPDDDEIPFIPGPTYGEYYVDYDGGTTVPTVSPWWAKGEEFPSGFLRKDVAPKDVRDKLLARFVSERSTFSRPANLRFVATVSGGLWVKFGSLWYRLTFPSSPDRFLSPSTIERYGLPLARAPGSGA